ncbi:MAG: glycoside hydrolase family 38 C-terminal domain-containing protein [Victivallales bacterium]
MNQKKKNIKPAQASRPIMHLISQAHLDPVWLWPWRDGFSEALTTLQSAVDRLREFPEMRYTCSSAVFYRWVQETDPRLFREIRSFIEQGRWEVVGGWIVQADTILTSEISRQGQLGQAWFREHLGVTAKIGYCVDSFGHSAGLPSILSANGMHYYVFQRPSPGEKPDLPNLFWWEGPDGSRVLTWRLALGYGQGPGTSADELESSLRKNWSGGLVPGMPVGTWFVGIGNHGGGPTRKHVERLRELSAMDDPSLPELRFSTLADFFAGIEKQPGFKSIPVIRGELLHHARGCYAANTRLKRMHRQAEHELLSAEYMKQLASQPNLKSECRNSKQKKGSEIISDLERPAVLPPEELREPWWTLCFNQFHDILPGSSVPAAYEQVADDIGMVRHSARHLAVKSTQALARRADASGIPEGSLFLVNQLPWTRTAIVALDTFVSPHGDSPITHLEAPDGEKIQLQWTAADAAFGPYLKEWKKLVAAVPLPASSSRLFELSHGGIPATIAPSTVPMQVKNAADSARLVIVEDRADTWGHDVNRWDKVLGVAEKTRDKLMDDGPVFRRSRRWLSWNRSTVIMDFVEWKTLGVIELVLHINWQDRFQALKLELPLTMRCPKLQVRTPGAVVDRPLDGDEWFWGDWLSVSDGGQRLVLVSDGVSAYDSTPERLRLTLLRCVPHAQYMQIPHPEDSPAPFLDEGWQQARFWLASPPSAPSTGALDQLAGGLSAPFEHMLDSAHGPQLRTIG